MNVLIAVATHNRPNITRISLEYMQPMRVRDRVVLAVYDDASTAYSVRSLGSVSDLVVRFDARGGIERSRARAFRDFVYQYTQFDLLYLTDNDTLHDPDSINQLIRIFQGQINTGSVSPVGLFNSVFHQKSILCQYGDFYLSSTCPGVSQCYTREMAHRIVEKLNYDSLLESSYGWDYRWPATLGEPFILPVISYVEHLARDREEGGLHTTISGTDRASFLRDYQRDRAVNPSVSLVEETPKVIDRLFGVPSTQALP